MPQQTNAYGELNPLYPIYDDKEEEMEELMRFYEFSYCKQGGYSGTGVFEITDDDSTFYLQITTDPNNGASAKVLSQAPTEDYTFYVICPYQTFHDVFWGYTTARTLVMGGGCKVKDWAYRQVLSFGLSFDMTTTSWNKFYKSGVSIKKMLNQTEDNEDIVNVGKRIDINNKIGIKITDHRSIGAFPFNSNDAHFIYEWKPIIDGNDINVDIVEHELYELNNVDNINKLGNLGMDRDNKFDLFIYSKDIIKHKMNLWRDEQRNKIINNNLQHISLWNNSNTSSFSSYYDKMQKYRENLSFNPVLFGKDIAMKWMNIIKTKSTLDHDLLMNML